MQSEKFRTAHVQPEQNEPRYEAAFCSLHKVMYQGFTSTTLKEQKNATDRLVSYQGELSRHMYFIQHLREVIQQKPDNKNHGIEDDQVAALSMTLAGLSKSIADMIDSMNQSSKHRHENIS